MKIAIVHDYLNQFGGAERVVGVLHEMFPEAPIFTSVYVPERTFPCFQQARIYTSFMQHLPGIARCFRAYLFLYPLAFEVLDLTQYDLVLSSSSGWAHGIRKRKDALHVCYCYTPPRWLWDLCRYAERESFSRLTRMALDAAVPLLRSRDRRMSQRPDCYIAISQGVAARVRRCYGREPYVIYPPVEVEKFPLPTTPGESYLLVSRLIGYKRVDLVVDTFNQLGLPLRIVGDGPLRAALEKHARSNVAFLGAVSEGRLIHEYVHSRALIFPGEEDFGMVPLEANACGRPVIAFAGGGVLETVLEGATGVFFGKHSVADLAEAVVKSQKINFDSFFLREHARKFSKEAFKRRLLELLETQYSVGRIRPAREAQTKMSLFAP